MVLAAILLLIGLFVLYKGVREWQHVRRLRREGRQAFGTVTSHERKPSGARAVVVSWTDDYGTTHQLTSSQASSVPTIGIGEPVTVRYLAGNPASAYIDERRENVRNVLGMLVLGLGFTAAGVTLFSNS
ncbi:DUF3592 domain-containing protein [Actinoplanes sp. TRM 88003]|uniref:DUF3592 domain-containing protein n=1 Tax=Paractinoplanes aksuensis TaxID=2939490 RepID=A0ABT1DY50_9ACTN|nr:DUF3592 domain-containing protein [Actinoplanes aksuensis]MCO8274855.1 DUF3592 domain-containing protein [Actinoplanes aksuensis]